MTVARRVRCTLPFVAVVATMAPSSSPGQVPDATHLVAQRSITIARTAMAVWPHIVEPSAWKQGNRLTHAG